MSPNDDAVPRRKAGRPPRISLDDVVQAAEALSLDGLTISAVAERLGVTGPAVYHYVANVEELSALVCDRVALAYPLPDPEGRAWADWVREAAWNLRRMLESTPGMAAHAMRYPSQSPGILALVEQSLGAAKAAGFDPIEAMYVTRAVAHFVEGWVARREAIAKVARAIGRTPGEAVPEALDKDSRYPNLQAYLDLAGSEAEEDQFSYTLELIVEGAARRLSSY